MLELQAFGGLALRGAESAQPKRLALLCYLTLAGSRSFHRRDSLVALFWPELDDSHARHSLRQALTAIRAMDERLVVTRGDEEVGIPPGVVACDVLAFEQAVEQGELVTALERYTGPFVDGFFLGDCPEFERWVEGERARLSGLAADAAWKLADQEQVPAAAVQWARRAAAFQPEDEGALRRLVSVLDRAGDRSGALREYEVFARRLREQYQAEPAPETQAVIAAVRERREPGVQPASGRAVERSQHGGGGGSVVHRRSLGHVGVSVGLAAALIVLIVGWVLWQRHTRARDVGLAPRSVAVLPFENAGGSPEEEYFSDGMSDDIATALITDGVRVAPRTSSYAYKGKRPRPEEVGTTLSVDAVLTGSVSRLGTRLRVTAELVGAKDGAALWSYSGERETTDIFGVQRAIVDSIVALLRPRLGGPRPGPMSYQTPDVEAHDLLLQGRYQASFFTRDGLLRSMDLFDRALARDPNYALAYANLALSYEMLADGYAAPIDVYPKAVAAIARALALDSTLAEAWSTRARLNALYEWDWPRARSEIDGARALNPDDVQALAAESQYWSAMRRSDRMVEPWRQAVQLDPLSPGTSFGLAWAFYVSGQPDSAVAQSLAVAKLQPGFAYLDAVEGYAYVDKGMLAEAEQAFGRAESVLGHRSPGLAYVLALRGRRAEAEQVLQEIERTWRTAYVVPEFIATAYLALADTAKVYEWLERGVDLHSAFATFNPLWPPFRAIRHDPRFMAVLRRINIPGLPAPSRDRHTNREQEVRSIAVLPLADVSPEDRQPYFAEGMTEAVITELGRVGAFDKVISRTSVMRYQGVSKPMPEIARELGVDALVEGSVARAGGRVRVQARFIHGKSERTLWQDTYERDLSDVLGLQGDLARAIAEAVQLRLRVPAKPQTAKVGSVNPAAYDAYLRGSYHLNRHQAGDRTRALAELQQAVQLDSLFAGAQARLAEIYAYLGYFGYPGAPPAPEAFAAANAAVARALALDSSLSDAYVALARIRWTHDPDLGAAERAARRAVELNTVNADAHFELGRLLGIQGRADSAIKEVERALELDPLTSVRHADVAWVYWLVGRYEEAIKRSWEVVSLDPTEPESYLALGNAYLAQGKYPEAVAALERGYQQGQNRTFLGVLGFAYAREGRTVDARRVLAELRGLYRAHLASPYYVAWIYFGLGQRDSALTWLEIAADEGDGHLVFIAPNPVWEPLRSEPRFQALLRKAGLR